jgi:pimeloyl-ACP methyl ester carboxylesterase
VDIVSGATPPDVSRETPSIQRVISKLAMTAPFVLRGLLRVQTWLARRLHPSFVVSQYTADDPDESIPDDVAEIVKADFVEALSSSRCGTVTEFRNAAMSWDVDFEAIDTEIRLWHGEDDTNVPIEDAKRFASTAPPVQLQVLEDADHIQVPC